MKSDETLSSLCARSQKASKAAKTAYVRQENAMQERVSYTGKG